MSLSEGFYCVLPVEYLDNITNQDLLNYLRSLPEVTIFDGNNSITARVWDAEEGWTYPVDMNDVDPDGAGGSPDFGEFLSDYGTQIWLHPVSGGMGGDLSDII